MTTKDVLAAGAVVFRPGKQVLLVHRPKYDDWSFPKGKLDPGEHATTAAVREVGEETGLRVRLCVPLPAQRYRIAGGRTKKVFYWTGRALEGDGLDGFEPNDEIDDVRWLPYAAAREQLTYPRDRDLLREAHRARRRTRPLVVLRHGKARSRDTWHEDDRLRPLIQRGLRQARQLVPVLAAYGVNRIVSSSSTRCVETLRPYADATGWKLEQEDRLSEQDATPESIAEIVDELVSGEDSVVLCTHRPVLPSVFDALGVRDPGLEVGGMLVAHLRQGTLAATEVHQIG